MDSIAAVGEERGLLGFKPFGVDVWLCSRDKSDIEELFKSVVKRNYKLILISESLALRLEDQINELRQRDLPVVLTIRGMGEKTSFAFEHLRSLVMKAIGTDIFKES